MGLFNNLVKIADHGIKAVENGSLEKTLVNAVDKLEVGVNTAIVSTEKLANLPEKVSEQAKAKQEQVVTVAQNVRQHTVRTIDVIQK